MADDPADDGRVISPAAAPNDPFHSLLFGTTEVASIVTEKKTRALPPDEMTAVLFDLAARADLAVPCDVLLGGGVGGGDGPDDDGYDYSCGAADSDDDGAPAPVRPHGAPGGFG